MATGFVVNPPPRSGTGAFGQVPGVVTTPPSRYAGIQQVYPGLTDLATKSSGLIGGQLQGVLSPDTINTIQDEAARFGVTSGLPLTQFSGQRGLRNLGRTVEQTQQKGLENYNQMLSTMGNLVLDPELAASIAAWNATMNAAPNPQLAANEMMRRYQQGMRTGSAAGGPGAGTFSLPVLRNPAADFPVPLRRCRDPLSRAGKAGLANGAGSRVTAQ